MPDRPLNLMVVTNDLLVGGVQRNIVRYLNHFDKARFKLHLATVCAKGPLIEGVKDAGAGYAHVRGIAKRGAAKTITPQGVFRLAGLMNEWKIDVAQTRLFLGNTIGRSAAILAKVPVIVAAEHSTYFNKTAAHRAIDRFLARRSDRIVAVSNVVKEFTAKQEKIDPERITVIHNGLDLSAFEGLAPDPSVREEFGIPADAFVLGSVSRLIPEKSFDKLVRQLPAVAEKVPDLRFLLVGDGPHRSAVETAVKEAGLVDRAVLAGERDDVPRLLSAMDLFVLPSRREGLPTAVLEAMAAGLAVVTHDLPQFREIVTDGKDGVVVDCKEDAAAVDALVALANDPARRKKLGAAAKRRAQDFSIEKMVTAYADLYAECWAKKGLG